MLNIDHIQARSKGGSNSVKNLLTSCRKCNESKGNLSLDAWLKKQKGSSALVKNRIKGINKTIAGKFNSMRDMAAMNASRYKLGDVIKEIGLPVRFCNGAQTKFNRKQQGYAKDHWIDAACASDTGAKVNIQKAMKPLIIKATGHGSRQMCLPDKYGFPRTKPKEISSVHGFKTGDLVKANIPSGKYKGSYTGRIAVRKKGSFSLKHKLGKNDVSYKYCKKIHSSDGFSYQK